MARSDALARVRFAYERAHVYSALRGLGLAALVVVAAVALHRTTETMWLMAALLAATLATFGWRGGAWRRGGLAGLVAGLPVFIAPALYFMLTRGHCPECTMAPTLTCMLVCVSTSTAVGIAVGYIATRDHSPRRFGLGAVMTAVLTGLLGCATTGLGGAIGIAIGLVVGGVTGWVVASRAAHA